MFNFIRLTKMNTLAIQALLFHQKGSLKRVVLVTSILVAVGGVVLPSSVHGEIDPASLSAKIPPMEVGVISIKKQTVPLISTIPGRAIAYQQADIRPRVDGVIQSILYQAGKVLNEGDPLFQLDNAIYQAQVAADEAKVATAVANLSVADTSYQRALSLKGSGFTVADVEQAKATLATAQATLSAAKAALNYSKIQLSWTTIRSPISGVADVATVSVGDLVTGGQNDYLTIITRLDPIDVDMLVPSARILSVRSQIKEGKLAIHEKIKATLILENGEIYETMGSLLVPGSIVSTTTGTVPMRFRFDNPERRILPGMFLRGDVAIGDIQAFLVPQRAAKRQHNGQLSAFIVGDSGQAEQVLFNDSGSWNNNWIVTEGLNAGQQIIIDGLKTVSTGTKVKAVQASIDSNGLVTDVVHQKKAEQ